MEEEKKTAGSGTLSFQVLFKHFIEPARLRQVQLMQEK